MISIKKNFLFIHIPKTGGNSIQNILQKYSEDEIVILNSHQDGKERFELRNKEYKIQKHSTINDYKEVIETNVFDNLFKFSTLRNPWDLMISFYFSPHRKVDTWNRNDFINLLNTAKTFNDYTTLNDTENNKFIHYIKNLLSNKMNNNKPLLDYIIRFENLNKDFITLSKLIDIPIEPLPIRNQSNRKHYSQYYDSELINLVRNKFSNEIELGEYEF